MFCKNCGSENAEGVKFCANCGAVMAADEQEGNETVVVTQEAPVVEEAPVIEEAPVVEAAPAQESAPVAVAVAEPAQEEQILGKKGRGGAIAIIAAAAVAVVALIVAAVLLLPRLFGAPLMCVYLTDDNELMYISKFNGKAEAKEITDEEVDSVLFSENGKYIYYYEEESDELYVIKTSDIGKKKADPEKIASDVYDASVLKTGDLLYEKEDGEIRVFDGKDSYKLVKESVGGYYNEDDNCYYYTTWEDNSYTLYRIPVEEDADEEELLEGFHELYSSYDDETLVYGVQEEDGTYTVYSAKRGEKGDKILKDLREEPVGVSAYGEDITIYYYEYEEAQFCLYDFVTDELRSSDQNIKEPSTSDYKTYNYSYWGGYYTTDWDAYYEAYDKWYAKDMRDDIRNELENTMYTKEYRTLHCYENGNDTVIAEDIGGTTWGNMGSVMFYYKEKRDIVPTVDVSELYYAGEVEYYMDFTGDVLYQNVNGKESEFEDTGKFDAFSEYYGYGLSVIPVSESEVALWDTANYEERPLWIYTIKDNELTDGDKIADKVVGVSGGSYEGKSGLFFYEKVEEKDGYDAQGDFVFYADGDFVDVAEEADVVRIMTDSDLIVKTCDRKDGEYTLCVIEKGDETEIVDDAQQHYVLESDDIIYVSGDDLHYWNGKESVRIAKDVQYVWLNEYAAGSSYICYGW